MDAVKLLEQAPNLRVIINHRCNPSVDVLKSKEYMNGIKELSLFKNTHMKVSFFGLTDPTWEHEQLVLDKAEEIIKLFTSKRCMFATNFPCDSTEKFGSWTGKGMVETFKKLAARFEPYEAEFLWKETAMRTYRIGDYDFGPRTQLSKGC
jgi:predicted TIM-barrel fold metal-dependent hydrolase